MNFSMKLSVLESLVLAIHLTYNAHGEAPPASCLCVPKIYFCNNKQKSWDYLEGVYSKNKYCSYFHLLINKLKCRTADICNYVTKKTVTLD